MPVTGRLFLQSLGEELSVHVFQVITVAGREGPALCTDSQRPPLSEARNSAHISWAKVSHMTTGNLRGGGEGILPVT